MNEKSVLISIRPKWCELIASGKKTIEVRKSRPKIETPFKCYIYCTLTGSPEAFVVWGKDIAKWNRENWGERKGKVIGEFVCDGIMPISIYYSDPESRTALKEFPFTGLTDKEIIDYLGNGKGGYGLHISALKIYDKPRELSEFCFPSDLYCEKELCGRCPKDQAMDQNGEYEFDCEWKKPVTRAPQSWCYVEDVNAGA